MVLVVTFAFPWSRSHRNENTFFAHLVLPTIFLLLQCSGLFVHWASWTHRIVACVCSIFHNTVFMHESISPIRKFSAAGWKDAVNGIIGNFRIEWWIEKTKTDQAANVSDVFFSTVRIRSMFTAVRFEIIFKDCEARFSVGARKVPRSFTAFFSTFYLKIKILND